MAKGVGHNSSRTRQRMETAARLESVGIPDAEIARHIHLTPAGLAQMKQRNDYKALRLQLMTGILSEMDAAISEDIGELRKRIKENVPLALQAIIDTIAQKTDPKLRLAAAESLLDRDGRFSKSTRVSVDTTETKAEVSEKDARISSDLVNAMGGIKLQNKPPVVVN